MNEFVDQLSRLPKGYSEGWYLGQKYGTTVSCSSDGRRYKLYAEELAGNNHISLNAYLLENGKQLLKPCEMPEAKVMDFVMNYSPEK